MNVIAIHSSNRPDGLSARLAAAVLEGAGAAGASTELVSLNDLHIETCQACPPAGWGQCRAGQDCVLEDDFQGLRAKIVAADALVFVTPVYFWDLSESAKRFLDRLRRAEWPRRDSSPLRAKPVVGIAAAGGSGTGAVPAIANLERYMTYLQMQHVVYLPVSRQNQALQIKAAREAGAFLAAQATAASG
ncbi:MAG: flavodoxin family protein [Bacillota bacterium]|nr:flavodoxin family protein [Bacillota bacterium]